MAKKKSHWILKTIAFPFKVVGKTIYYAGKGVYLAGRGTANLIKKSSEKRKLEKLKPKNLPEYKRFLEIKALDGSLDDFEDLLQTRGKIGLILGGRGTGKSALGMRIIENLKSQSGAKVQTWGFDDKRLPDWIKSVKQMQEIENNSYVLIDESGISFSSRNSMAELNKLLTELLLIARHKNISIIFITQNSSNIDINILRQADFLLLKPHSLLQLDFERKIIKEIYRGVSKHLEELRKLGEQNLTYIYSNNFKGFVRNDLPSFWSENLSKSFADEKIEEKKDKK